MYARVCVCTWACVRVCLLSDKSIIMAFNYNAAYLTASANAKKTRSHFGRDKI
jgi:hypothetical protein